MVKENESEKCSSKKSTVKKEETKGRKRTSKTLQKI